MESELAAYTGHKYCVSLNSCGSGIFLMLKCVGVQPGDKVAPCSCRRCVFCTPQRQQYREGNCLRGATLTRTLQLVA